MRMNQIPLLVVFMLFSCLSHARLPKDSDLSAVAEVETADFDVKKDGTFTLDYFVRIAVLSEAGRESQAVKNVSFNSRASTFELLAAKTINDGIEIQVAPSNVEIKEVGDSKVFDTTKEAIISFPSVRVGSRLEFRYRLKYREVPIENFFATGMNIDLQNLDVFKRTVRSALPLYVSQHDKLGLLSVQSRRDGSKYVVEIANKEKIRLAVVQEDSPYVENGRLPSVIVSTQETWNGFAQSIIEEQEKLLDAALPKSLEEIRVAAEKEPPSRRLAVVAAKVAQEFRYFGDWRRRKGGHVPRSLKEIADTAYGDCKDMSLVVVAIARKLGLKADLAWIWRSDVYLDDSYYRLPNDYGFNHAVARVEEIGVDGKIDVQWIDATNPVAIPRMVFADIAQRPALVLSKGGVHLDRTPELKSSDSIASVQLGLDMKRDGTFDLSGKLKQTGRAATHAEWALLYVPREQLQYDTARWLARNEKLERYDITLPKDASRVVRDLTFETKFSIGDLGLRTTAGIGFPLLRNDTIDLVLLEPRERFSDVWLGPPGIFEENYSMSGARVVGTTNIGCDLKSDWIRLSRSVVSGKRGVEIKSQYEVLKSVIPNERLKSAEFAMFQSQVRRCFNRSAVILSLTPSKGSRSN